MKTIEEVMVFNANFNNISIYRANPKVTCEIKWKNVIEKPISLSKYMVKRQEILISEPLHQIQQEIGLFSLIL
jgi:hypothetical protein